MQKKNIIGLVLALIAIGGIITYLEMQKTDRRGGSAIKSLTNVVPVESKKNLPKAIELQGISGYINADKISINELIGKKVILVDFWTYSCINCQRTQPYLNAWYDKYRDQGLEIIGVHTPEFEFEKVFSNVKAAASNAGIKYPIVQDNDFATWSAYKNRYWPRKYLIDIDGYIVYDHIGEGGYEETETKIQELLEERKSKLKEEGEIAQGVSRPDNVVKIDPSMPISPETYFGAKRNEFLENGDQNKTGEQAFSLPQGVIKNRLYLSGKWNIFDEYARNLEAKASIIYRYEGKAVYMVARSDKPVKIHLGRDGKPLAREVAGVDVQKDGVVEISTDRLYKLIDDSAGGEHTLQIIIDEPGVEIYTFTFG